MTRQPSSPKEAIDAALRSIGGVTPDSGMEGRVLSRLAATRIEGPRHFGRYSRLPDMPRRIPRFAIPALGFVSVGLVCALMIGGSVSHSRHISEPAAAPPVLRLPVGGVGVASAVQPASPSSAPLPADSSNRGRASHRTQAGRARIAPHAHRAAGLALPNPAANPRQ